MIVFIFLKLALIFPLNIGNSTDQWDMFSKGFHKLKQELDSKNKLDEPNYYMLSINNSEETRSEFAISYVHNKGQLLEYYINWYFLFEDDTVFVNSVDSNYSELYNSFNFYKIEKEKLRQIDSKLPDPLEGNGLLYELTYCVYSNKCLNLCLLEESKIPPSNKVIPWKLYEDFKKIHESKNEPKR